MNVITIGREFGSGGRELGKRLAEELGYAYYDDAILTAIAKQTGLSQAYVESIVERADLRTYSVSFGRTFSFVAEPMDNHWKIIQSQNDVLKELAQKSDCVFVGRCADVILEKLNPLNIFVYADMNSKMARCRAKAPEGENLTDKEMMKQIKETEKLREKYYRTVTDLRWGEKDHYHLMVNTSGKEIKKLIPSIAAFCRAWFE